MAGNNIAKKWRKLSGEDNWNKLLDPLDIDLRRYLIQYGERVQAGYDTFIKDRRSRYTGASKFSEDRLFLNVGLDKGNPFKYSVVKYIYATADVDAPQSFILKSRAKDSFLKQSNWMGYVAVATDAGKRVLGRRDIMVAWRGTIQVAEWVENFDFPLTSASMVFKESTCAKVHAGFFSIYTSRDSQSLYNKTSAREQVTSTVKQLVEKFKNEETSITVVGHSLGATLAQLNGGDIAINGFNKSKSNKSIPVTVFAYGSPSLGNSCLRELMHNNKSLHILRISNATDYITRLPPVVGYTKIGKNLLIDTSKSQFLKRAETYAKRHNMEAAYLHGLAGSHGVEGEFKLEIDRDIALVNKSSDLLRDKYLVPEHWWVQQNMGMVQKTSGAWELKELEGYGEDRDENVIQPSSSMLS